MGSQHMSTEITFFDAFPTIFRGKKRKLLNFTDPAKSKRGREEGDGTENVINCRDVCRKLS